MVDVVEAIFIDLTGLDEDERVLVKYMLATSRAPRAPFLMVVVDTWEALEAILEHGSDVRIILRTCKAAAPYVSLAAQAPAAALRAAEAFKHFQGGAAIFPIVRKGGDKKCYPRCLSALHSLLARLPPVARMGVGNYRIMVDNLMLAMQPPEDGSAVLYVLMPGECAAASCEPDSPDCYGCSPAIHACAQLGSAKDANMLYIFDATPDVCTSLFARWALFRTWTKEETQALRVGGNWWLQEGGATLTSMQRRAAERGAEAGGAAAGSSL